MLGGLLARIGMGARTSALPPELVLAIECAHVVWRPSRADDPDAAPIVTVATIGRFTYDRDTATRRIGAAYPELTDAQRARAAKLLEAQIGRRLRAPRRDPFEVDWRN